MSKNFKLCALLECTLLLYGCGYHLAEKKLDAGRGLRIAVPTFANGTTTYRLEQRLTEAVRQELIRRTKFTVVSEDTGDMLVSGEIVGFSSVPVIFNQQGRGSSYSISVAMKISLTDKRSNRVLFKNDNWGFHDVFELGQVSGDFVPEDTPAMERLARQFASAFVASVLHTKP